MRSCFRRQGGSEFRVTIGVNIRAGCGEYKDYDEGGLT